MAKLSDFCRINMGQSPDSSSYNENGKGMPFFQGNADFGELHPKVRVWCNAPTKIAYPNDILISVRAPIGALNIADVECCIGRGLASLTTDADKCYQKYLWYALESKVDELNSKGTGSTFKAISKSVLFDTEIPLPSLGVQKEISDIFDRTTALIRARKEQLKKLDELVKSRFIELFGDLASPCCQWKTRTLIETCVDKDDIKCGPFGTQLSKDEYQSCGVAVWEIPQINNRFTTKPTHYLTQEKAQQLSAYSIVAGDIAMSRKGNVGKCAIFPADFQDGIIHSDVLRIRVDTTRVLPIFMMYQLHYSNAVQHQIELVSSGAIMAGINVTKLKQILVHIPPMELQNEFVTFVEQTDKLKFDTKQALEKLEILKKSLMQQYFG